MKKGLCLILLSTAVVVSACNKNNNNMGTPATVTGFSNLPAGNYSLQQTLQPGDTSMYSNGCAASGSPLAVPQIDARLAPGQVYETTFKSVAGPGFMSATTQIENTIVIRSASQLVERLSVVSGDYLGFLEGSVSQATCLLDAFNNYNCSYNPQSIAGTPTPITSPSCTFTAVSSSPDVHSTGTYSLPSGQTYQAFQYTSHQVGYINCNNNQVGSGTADFMSITSNQVPSENATSFCGGTNLYTRYVLTTTAGNIVWALSSERTAIH